MSAAAEAGRLRVAVVGCGAITQSRYVPALKKLDRRYDVRAVVNPSPRSRDFVGERFPQARRFPLLPEDLAEAGPLDAALLLTPPDGRAELVERCLAAGLHVLAEKPLALTADAALAMAASARRADRTLAVAHTRRHDPTYAVAAERIAAADVAAARAITLEAPSQGVVELAPLGRTLDPRPEFELEIPAATEEAIAAAVGSDDPRVVRYYRWVLAESLVHDLDLVASVIAPVERVEYAGFASRGVGVTAVVACGAVPVTLNWTLTPGLARYDQLFQFDCPDARYSLRYPSPFLPNASASLTTQWNATATGDVDVTEVASLEDSFVRLLDSFADTVAAGVADQSSAVDAARALAAAEAVARAHVRAEAVAVRGAG